MTPKAPLKKQYDFVICGSGPAACALAGRLGANPAVSVLVIEAGPLIRGDSTDVTRAWASNVGSSRDWQFQSEPEAALDGRVIDYSMGRIVGGGSSINASVWSRGHEADWNHMASVARDAAWNYESVLAIYRRIENYAGDIHTRYHGYEGPVTVTPASHINDPSVSSLAGSFVSAAAGVGLPIFPEQNGALQRVATGVSGTDLAVHGRKRSSVIDGYLAPVITQGNVTLLTEALVARIGLRQGRAVGVEVVHGTQSEFVEAACEVIVAAGAVQTPKLLMHSGIGDAAQLSGAGIDCIVDLPGVGQNLQDHPLISLAWATSSMASVSASAQAVAFLQTGASASAPDTYLLATEIPSPEDDGGESVSWAIGAALLRPASRGSVSVLDANPASAPQIRANYLTAPEDLLTLKRALSIAREIGASGALRHLTSRTISAPDDGDKGAEAFIRARMRSGWHLCGTCRVGDDENAVVDGRLQVRGVSNLSICDTSVLPDVTRGNTMAPAIVIGERLSDILSARYQA